jgi:hypothetical protein
MSFSREKLRDLPEGLKVIFLQVEAILNGSLDLEEWQRVMTQGEVLKHLPEGTELDRLKKAGLHACAYLLLNSDGRSRLARQILEEAMEGTWEDMFPKNLHAENQSLRAELDASRRALGAVHDRLVDYEDTYGFPSVDAARDLGRAKERCKYWKRPEWTDEFGTGQAPSEPSQPLSGK